MASLQVSAILLSIITLLTLLVVIKGIKIITNNDPVLTKKRPVQQFVFIFFAWIILTGFLSMIGIFDGAALPPKPMFAALAALTAIILFSFSASGRSMLMATPLHWLIFFQAFRVLVELWFWHGYQTGFLPQVMSFEGANHDIYAGLLAIVAGYVVFKFPYGRKPVVIAFNITGIILLANTLRAAALSMPSPVQQYPFDERLLLLGNFPFIYLPAVLVPLAFGFHFLSLRQLWLHRKKMIEKLMA